MPNHMAASGWDHGGHVLTVDLGSYFLASTLAMAGHVGYYKSLILHSMYFFDIHAKNVAALPSLLG